MLKSVFGGEQFVFDCRCKNLDFNEICQNCVNVRYFLNFVADKTCVQNDLPQELANRMFQTKNI